MNARRDALAKAIYYNHHDTFTGDLVAAAAILALPIEQARDRVIEAARLAADVTVYGAALSNALRVLEAAVAELDALEGK